MFSFGSAVLKGSVAGFLLVAMFNYIEIAVTGGSKLLQISFCHCIKNV